jgi:hypothetical protein
MRVLGDLGNYARFQAAGAIEAAAGQEGGSVAGIGAGVAAATALGGAMAQGLGTTAAISPAETAEDPIATIEKLHKLVTLGALSQEEFEAKKAELLLRRSGSPNRRRHVACDSASARFWFGHSPRIPRYRSSRGRLPTGGKSTLPAMRYTEGDRQLSADLSREAAVPKSAPLDQNRLFTCPAQRLSGKSPGPVRVIGNRCFRRGSGGS